MFAAPSSNENLVWQCRWLKSHMMFAVPWFRFERTHRERRLQAMWINTRDIPGFRCGWAGCYAASHKAARWPGRCAKPSEKKETVADRSDQRKGDPKTSRPVISGDPRSRVIPAINEPLWLAWPAVSTVPVPHPPRPVTPAAAAHTGRQVRDPRQGAGPEIQLHDSMHRCRNAGSSTGTMASHTIFQISSLPIGAAQVYKRVPRIMEKENAAVFEKSAHHAAHPNVFAVARQAWAQTVMASHDKVNLHTCLGCSV